MNDALPTSLEGKLPHYASALARLTRTLALRQATHPAAEYGLRVLGNAARPFEQPLTLTLESRHGPITVVADATRHAALQSIALDSEPRRAAALANMWLAAWLSRLDTGDGTAPSIKSISIDAHPSDVQGLHLALDAVGIETTLAVAHLPEALAADLERAWTREPAHAPLDALGDIVVPVAIRLRSRLCSPALLASLGRNDVLLGWRPGLPFSEGGSIDHASLRIGVPRGRQLHARVRVDTYTVTLETAVTLAPAAQPDTFDPLADASAELAVEPLVPVDAIDLPVHVELIGVNLSIAQIGSLQSGYVLDLPLPLADAAVRLVAYGQTLAFGKLVAIGDNLGVQIHRMAASDERQS